MPEICRFDGITVDMCSFDTDRHKSPHIHVSFRDAEYVYGLDGEVLDKDGNIPGKQQRKIREWIYVRRIGCWKTGAVQSTGCRSSGSTHYNKEVPIC